MGNKPSSQVAPQKEEVYGPKAERKCRDVFFLLIFIAFWVGMVIVAAKAFQLGNPDRATYPFDSYGIYHSSTKNHYCSTLAREPMHR